MPSVLDSPLRALSARLRRLGIFEFFGWWHSELTDLLPAPLRLWLQRESDRILISREGLGFAVYAGSADRATPAFLLISEEDGVNAASELEKLKSSLEEQGVPLVLCLDSSDVLARRLSFPLAVEPNLRQVLTFEMDRQTPFKADQVYFDFVIAARDEQQKLLHVDLVLVLRAHLDPLVAAIRKPLPQPLDQIDAWRGATGKRWGVNLLPLAVRPTRDHFWLKVNLGLAALVLVLLWVVMAQADARKTRAVAELNARIEAVREDARLAGALRTELADARDASSFLARKRAQTPAFLDVLNDVTALLPDDVWLERMMLAQDELQLTGQAKESSKLIKVLTKSKLLSNPQMRGPVQVDPRTGKERFSIAATQKKRGPESKPAAPAASKGGDSADKAAG